MKPWYVQKMHYPRNMVVEKIIPNIHDAFSVHPVSYGLLSTDDVAGERVLATKIEAGRAGETPALLTAVVYFTSSGSRESARRVSLSLFPSE